MKQAGKGKKGLAIVLVLAMLLSFMPAGVSVPVAEAGSGGLEGTWQDPGIPAESFAGGNGEESSPYEIATAKQLAYLAQQVNDEEDYEGKHFLLTADIDLGARLWIPIGDASGNRFAGHFDGNGKVISKLKIGTEEDKYATNGAGLFGYTAEGSSISDLGIVDAVIYSSADNVGGLVGSSNGTITECYATGAVTGTDRVGGLVGGNVLGSEITKSYATGTVDGNNSVGGLVGLINGTITESYATGTVDGDYIVGGLVGSNSNGTVTNSYATGTVDGINIVGGLVGDNATELDHISTITNSYATGAVMGNADEGGLVGSNNGTVTNSYYDEDTTGQEDTGKGEPKTTEELQEGNNVSGDGHPDHFYEDWSSDVWKFEPDDAYPVLRWTLTVIGDLDIGDKVVDNSWEWEHRAGSNYSGTGETKPVTWRVVANDHYTGKVSPVADHITLITEEVIGRHAFDSGNTLNHWGNSGTGGTNKGIRKFLNGDSYTGTDSDNYNITLYDSMSTRFKDEILTTTLPNKTLTGDSYETTDKIFLPSTTELGDTDHQSTYSIGENWGHFTSNTSRIAVNARGYKNNYWTRSPYSDSDTHVRGVHTDGRFVGIIVTHDSHGVRPALNLKTCIPVFGPYGEGSDAYYTLFEESPDYTITYDGNDNSGGTVPVDSNNYLPRTEVTVLGNTGSLVRTEFIFVGWNTAADGSGDDYNSGDKFIILDDIILYAQWKPELIQLGDLNIGDTVVDNSWTWEHRTGNGYTHADDPADTITASVTWIVVAKDHYTARDEHDATRTSVTLLSEKIIARHTFDNSTDRGSDWGSNHWGDSGSTDATLGLRKFLNGSSYNYDEGYGGDYKGANAANGDDNDYDVTFLDAFSYGFKYALLATEVPCKANSAGGSSPYEGEKYITLDKVFLPSQVELNGDTGHNHTDEEVWAYFTGADNDRRKAQEVNEDDYWYRTRSPYSDNADAVRFVRHVGVFDNVFVNGAHLGVRPALNLKSETPVSGIPGAGGAYVIRHQIVEKFTVTFDENGGETPAEPAEKTNIESGSTIDSLPTPPTRTGYSFAGWNTAPGEGGDEFTADTPVKGNITVYAQWEINKYTINAESTEGGTVTEPGEGEYDYDYATEVPLTATPDDGYHFTGWSVTGGFEGNFTSTTATQTTFTMPATDTTITAEFAINQYEVIFEDHDGNELKKENVDHGSAASPPDSPGREGYTFASWEPSDLTNITGPLTVTAQYTINQYTLSFDSAGGTPVASITQNFDTEITPPASPTRAGHTFQNWEPELPTTMPATDLGLKAQWSINQYTLTYHAGPNGSITGEATQTVNHGDSGTEVMAVPDDGYKFSSWSDDLTTATRTDIDVTSNLEFTAEFAINQYNVYFNSHGGKEVSPVLADFGSLLTAPDPAPTKTDFHFAGWYKDAEYSVAWDFNTDTVPARDITLHARWSETPLITLTIESTEGGTVTEPGEGEYDYDYAAEVSLTAAADTGYQFTGWSVTGGFEGNFTSTTATQTTFTMPATDTTITAHFKVDKSVLKALIEEADSLEGDGYTAYSWRVLEDALDSAKKVYDDPEATVKDVSDAITELQEAIDGLRKAVEDIRYGDVAGNGTINVTDAILVLRHIVGLIDLTNDNDGNLPAGALARTLVSGEGTEPTVSDAILILRHIVGLIDYFPVELNRDSLQRLVSEGMSMEEAQYSADGWEALQEALAEGESVLDDPDATDEEIADAARALIITLEAEVGPETEPETDETE